MLWLYGARLLRAKRRSRFHRDRLGRSGTFSEFVKMKHATRKKYYRELRSNVGRGIVSDIVIGGNNIF